MRLTILAAFVLVATPAFSIELFRYRGAAKDVSDMVKGQLRQMFFVVLLPDGTVIVPTVEKRL